MEMGEPEEILSLRSDEDIVPRPDPTRLTTGALSGMATHLRREIAALRDLFDVRLAGMDHALTLQQRLAERMPSEIDVKVQHLKQLHEGMFLEKFSSIATQFTERDTRMEQTTRDSKTAVDAALSAAKEAVIAQTIASEKAINKSEENFIKSIDQLSRLLNEMRDSINDKIDDLKSRLLLIEGKTVGIGTATTTHQTDRSFVVALIAVGVSAFSVLALVAFNLLKP